jgi:hypothetical protein
MVDRVRLTRPLPAEISGRDPQSGKFVHGNAGSRGNPLNARAQKIRSILLQELTDAEARKLARKLIKMAARGNLQAIKELLDRTIGKPPAFEILERLEKLEAMMEERSHGDRRPHSAFGGNVGR